MHTLVDRFGEALEQSGLGPIGWMELALRETSQRACCKVLEGVLNAPSVKVPDEAPRDQERCINKVHRTIHTLFGPVEVNRRWLKAPDYDGRFPFDDALGLIDGHTPTLATLMCRCSAEGSFGKAQTSFHQYTGLEIEARQFQRIVGLIGEKAQCFAEDSSIGERTRPNRAYVVMDATGAPMRKKELEGIKGKQADGSAKTREVKVGAIFTQDDLKSDEPWRDLDSTTYCSTTQRCEDFGTFVRNEFNRRFENAPETIVLGDGALWIWEQSRTKFARSVEIVDYYHASEHLSAMAEMMYPRDSDLWKQLNKKWKALLWEGKIEELVADANVILPNSNPNKKNSTIRYFVTNKERMRYAQFRSKNMFIGSGVVEAACKTIVGQRFKCSGMRWSLKGLNALLPIRTLLQSDRFEEFCQWIPKNAKIAA